MFFSPKTTFTPRHLDNSRPHCQDYACPFVSRLREVSILSVSQVVPALTFLFSFYVQSVWAQTYLSYSSYSPLFGESVFARETGINVDFDDPSNKYWILGGKNFRNISQPFFELGNLDSRIPSERTLLVPPSVKVFHVANNTFVGCESENDWRSYLSSHRKSIVWVGEITEKEPRRHTFFEIDGVIVDAFWLPTSSSLVVFAVTEAGIPKGRGRVLFLSVTENGTWTIQKFHEIENALLEIDDETITGISDWVFGGVTPHDDVWFHEGLSLRIVDVSATRTVGERRSLLFKEAEAAIEECKNVGEFCRYRCDTNDTGEQFVYTIPLARENAFLLSVQKTDDASSALVTKVPLEAGEASIFPIAVCFFSEKKVLAVTKTRLRFFEIDYGLKTLKETDYRLGNFSNVAIGIKKVDRGVRIVGISRGGVFSCFVSSK